MGTTQVPLANGKGFALVDDADAATVSGYSWYRHSNGSGGVYARAHVPGSGRGGQRILMHVLLAGPGMDHANGNGLDNTRINLREANASQQAANQAPRGGRRFRGVNRVPPRVNRVRPWRAEIRVNHQRRSLGYFATEEEAARAYDTAALAAWDQFARLNFPG